MKAPWYYLPLLILAGESVFILPFVLPRVFRPTVLATFAIDNTQLGLCFSFYGLVALGSYLVGGPLADRFAPRQLMGAALWLTALGGLLLATFPDYATLRGLYAYWGFTTIFLFWAPMIKATRVWGGREAQGRAFGFLDGGRGLVGALFGLLGVAVFAAMLGGEASLAESQDALRRVILVCTGIVAVVGTLVFFYLRTDAQAERKIIRERITLLQVWEVLRLPAVPLLMVIICCAYFSYKVTDVFSLYAREVMGYGEIGAARVGTAMLFIRPVVGVSAGLLADRTGSTGWLLGSFLVAAAGAGLFALGWVTPLATGVFVASTLLVALGVYAARALYFSVMQAGRIPLVLTGTAAGLISLVGYTPDIFSGPLLGYFLDGYPGITGQRYVFGLTAGFSLVGAVAAGWYHHRYG